jgi:hypothetical protein
MKIRHRTAAVASAFAVTAAMSLALAGTANASTTRFLAHATTASAAATTCNQVVIQNTEYGIYVYVSDDTVQLSGVATLFCESGPYFVGVNTAYQYRVDGTDDCLQANVANTVADIGGCETGQIRQEWEWVPFTTVDGLTTGLFENAYGLTVELDRPCANAVPDTEVELFGCDTNYAGEYWYVGPIP